MNKAVKLGDGVGLLSALKQSHIGLKNIKDDAADQYLCHLTELRDNKMVMLKESQVLV